MRRRGFRAWRYGLPSDSACFGFEWVPVYIWTRTGRRSHVPLPPKRCAAPVVCTIGHFRDRIGTLPLDIGCVDGMVQVAILANVAEGQDQGVFEPVSASARCILLSYLSLVPMVSRLRLGGVKSTGLCTIPSAPSASLYSRSIITHHSRPAQSLTARSFGPPSFNLPLFLTLLQPGAHA